MSIDPGWGQINLRNDVIRQPIVSTEHVTSAGNGGYRNDRSDQSEVPRLFDEHRDLRQVRDKSEFSGASAEHVEAVSSYLPIDLMRVLPRRMLRAA